MKRINEYRKLFTADANTTLKELKTTYRGLVKEWHPDKFQEGDELAEEAKTKSLQIIDAYHFLVGIAPETKEATLEEYTTTINEAGIDDFFHKGLLLTVSFLDGTTYEYYGVNKNVYAKMLNCDNPLRFGKRNVFNTFLYRKAKSNS